MRRLGAGGAGRSASAAEGMPAVCRVRTVRAAQDAVAAVRQGAIVAGAFRAAWAPGRSKAPVYSSRPC
ncbi:hypothetical protein GCM10009790_39340 [Georgenia ruanii]